MSWFSDLWRRLRRPRRYRDITAEFAMRVRSGAGLRGIEDTAALARLREMNLDRRRDVINIPLRELAESRPDEFAYELHSRLEDKRERGGVLNDAERGVDAVVWLEMEVNNGGFHQYFLNSDDDHPRLALEWLRRVGAAEVVALLETAMRRFPGGTPPADREARILALEELDLDTFNDLDEAFYALTSDVVGDAIRVWAVRNLDKLELPG